MKFSDKLYIRCIVFSMITIAIISILLICISIFLFKDNPTFVDIGVGCLGIFLAITISWDIIGDGIQTLKRMKKKTDDGRIY